MIRDEVEEGEGRTKAEIGITNQEISAEFSPCTRTFEKENGSSELPRCVLS